MSISNERQNEILGNALDWFSEHYEQEELLNILHDKLGMTDSEIDFFGFEFDSDIEDEKDLSIVHFHNDDEDYCLTTDAPFYLWEAANAYVNTIKDVKDRWSLDSIAENIADGIMIDERIYPILCKSMAPDGNIVSVVDFNQSVIFCGQFIHAILFCSLLLRLLSFDFSLRIFLAQAGQYLDAPEPGTYSTPHTVQFLAGIAAHRFVGMICNSSTKPMNL